MQTVSHRAPWVMTEPGRWSADTAVQVTGGRVRALENGNAGTRGDVLDHGPGVILPALINAHTHMSLAVLARGMPTEGGFLAWIRALMPQRSLIRGEKGRTAAVAAAREMVAAGCGGCGEFGPHFPVTELLEEAGLQGIVWQEFFGNRTTLPDLPPDRDGVVFSYAGHAPNTVSPALLRRIKARDDQLGKRFCLHLAESEEEVAFLRTGNGPWADFLQELQMDHAGWDCWGRRPVELAHELGILDRNTLAVHVLQTTPADLDLLRDDGARICLCPRSNERLHGRLPDVAGMLARGMTPALGTDSLASAPSLNLFEEMAFLYRRIPSLSPDTLLAMATRNGALALGRPDLGVIRPGSTARLIHVAMEADTPRRAAENLVTENFTRVTPLWDAPLPKSPGPNTRE